MNFYCLLIVPTVWVAVGFSSAFDEQGNFYGGDASLLLRIRTSEYGADAI